MPYDLSSRLVLGVASSALFDLSISQQIFDEHGVEEYRRYQEEQIDSPLDKGVAFPFIRRLLGLNDLDPSNPPVEVFVLSKNSPETGLRVMRSIKHHGLPVSRAIFNSGESPYRYMRPLGMSLFLSADERDVKHAIDMGLAAGRVMAGSNDDDASRDLRIAFDFDGVLSDDSSEKYYGEAEDLLDYLEREERLREDPISPGPLKQFLADINRIQALERDLSSSDPGYSARLHVSLITARNAPAHERAVRSLKDWGVSVDSAFFLGALTKASSLAS
ncbi:MAG: 5'-nucleotidase [Nocardioides sp.]